MAQRRLSQLRRQRCGNTHLHPGTLEITQIVERAGLGLHCGGIGHAGHIVPFLHQLLRRVLEAETRNGVFRDLLELHGGDLDHVIRRHLNAPLAEKVDVYLVPDAHGVEQGSVEVEYGCFGHSAESFSNSRAWSKDASDSLPESIRAISWTRWSSRTSQTVVATPAASSPESCDSLDTTN